MSEEEKKDPGFRVSDRRRFAGSESGEVRKEEPGPEAEKAPSEPQQEAGGKAEAPGGDEAGAKKPEAHRQEEPEPTALPEINFSTFVVSLSSSALIHLGLAPDPMTGEQKKDLAIAKQTIDMLGMLQEKTRGNLTEEESQLMESMLYDLRMRYVAESK